MDMAYDHLQEETLPSAPSSSTSTPPPTLNTEFQAAFQTISASPWGSRLGGLFATAKKQTSSLYSDAQKEYAVRSTAAAKQFEGLQKSLSDATRGIGVDAQAAGANTSFVDPGVVLPEGVNKEGEGKREAEVEASAERPESLPADIMKEAGTLFSRLRLDASSRLTSLQKAEDAADEALLKFGTNIRSFLRDAVTVTAPSSSSPDKEVLFETNDAEGKRVIHSSRFDAQLHVIHSSRQSFVEDPDSEEYAAFAKSFDVEEKTDDIAADLEKYPELRRAMEKLVPESVEYAVFWSRYYFLRKVIQEEEQRRREVLKGASQDPQEEITWSSDSEDSDTETSTPTTTTSATTSKKQPTTSKKPTTTATPPNTSTSTPPTNTSTTTLTPATKTKEAHEEDGKSSSSDASYDVVSGAPSRAAGSPGEKEREKVAGEKKIEEESDEDDWE